MRMKKQRIRILLVQIVNRNLGDAVIADNTEFLIRSALPLRPFTEYDIIRYDIASQNTWMIPYADAIIFAGGGLLKFKRENFDRHVIRVLQAANQANVPCYFHAVGVEGYDPENERCLLLKEALHLPCVKVITTRDDPDTLKQQYLPGSSAKVLREPDSAVFCKETYALKPKKQRSVIGLGITRHKLFGDYAINTVDRDFPLPFWKEVTSRLEAEGLPWEIFTNGLESDERFAKEVLDYIGHGTKAAAPMEGRELAELINGYRGVIAFRMHSNIIAFSLDLPSVGAVWNEKIAFWGTQIGHPERFLRPEALSAEAMVSALKQALSEPPARLSARLEEKEGFSSLKQFLKDLTENPDRPKADPDTAPVRFSDTLVATALGGICLHYKNLNVLEGLKTARARGFRLFEADVRLTLDGMPVLVNGWNQTTYGQLGITPSEEGVFPALSEEDFVNANYYGHYATVTLPALLTALTAAGSPLRIRPQERYLLDIGRPSGEDRTALFAALKNLFAQEKYAYLQSQFALRLQRKADVNAYRKTGLSLGVVYYLAPKKEDATPEEAWEAISDTFAFCHEKGIQTLSLNKEVWTPELAEVAREQGLKLLLFSYGKEENFFEATKNGADLIGSFWYGPKELDALL